MVPKPSPVTRGPVLNCIDKIFILSLVWALEWNSVLLGPSFGTHRKARVFLDKQYCNDSGKMIFVSNLIFSKRGFCHFFQTGVYRPLDGSAWTYSDFTSIKK